MRLTRRTSQLACILMLSFKALSLKADDAAIFKPYGFIHANIIGASRGVDSFENTNLTAPTTVSSSTTSQSDRGRDSFQVGQSRLGTTVEYGRAIGRFEVDFIDFKKASPTTQAMPRLRIANIDFRIDPNQTLSFGQDWDLFASPAKPLTYNIVGLYFQAGNVGFMRQQIRYRYKTDSNWTMGAAIGLLNKNPTASDSEIEMTGLPTASFLISLRINPDLELGLTGITGKVRPASYPTALLGVYGLNSFLNLETGSGVKVHGSIYYGMNLASAGALSLSSASTSGSAHELGGVVSTLLPLSGLFSLQGGIGGAQIMEEGRSPAEGLSSANILANWKTELALIYHPEKYMSLYLQSSFMQTTYRLVTTRARETVAATALQVGCLLQF